VSHRHNVRLLTVSMDPPFSTGLKYPNVGSTVALELCFEDVLLLEIPEFVNALVIGDGRRSGNDGRDVVCKGEFDMIKSSTS
jgi:hypothetical protein